MNPSDYPTNCTKDSEVVATRQERRTVVSTYACGCEQRDRSLTSYVDHRGNLQPLYGEHEITTCEFHQAARDAYFADA